MIKEYKIYTVKKGDTLAKISKEFYGSPNFIDKIVNYNNLKNANAIFINQQIELPGIEQVNEPTITVLPLEQTNTIIKVPHGINEIISTFGNIKSYITKSGDLSPTWNIEHLTSATLPFSIKLAWDFDISINRITCHKKLARTFFNVFEEIKISKLESEIKSFGGAFNYRTKRRSGNFSTHSWGIAIDLNPLSNAMGTKGDMHPKIVEIFRKHGFKWGGDWAGKGCDPMHFQYCTGY